MRFVPSIQLIQLHRNNALWQVVHYKIHTTRAYAISQRKAILMIYMAIICVHL